MGRIVACIVLTVFMAGTVFLARFADEFKAEHYPVEAGVTYPDWYPIELSSADGIIDDDRNWCDGKAADNAYCGLLAQFHTTKQASNERSIIDKATSQSRDTTYCDHFYGTCAKQPTNITLQDAARIFSYLDLVYLQKAEEDVARGRMARAHDAITRIRYLLGPVDLPLGSAHCCDSYGMLFIAPAFLGDQEKWRDRAYVEAVLNLINDGWKRRNGSGGRTGYDDVDIYAAGIDAADAKCYRSAENLFSWLAQTDQRREVKELSAYMALLSRFRNLFYGGGQCQSSQTPEMTEDEVATLRSLITRRSFLNDVGQMDDALAARGAPSDAV